jgi:hypothetical protein
MKQQPVFTRTMPPRIQDVKIYFNQKGMPDLEAEHFFLFYEKKEWKGKKGNFMKSWKNIAWSWIQSALRDAPYFFNKKIH